MSTARWRSPVRPLAGPRPTGCGRTSSARRQRAGVVANVVGTATDLDGGSHTFDGGHYIAVTGYRDGGDQMKIADSADASRPEYWISTDVLADWIASRGYSA